MISCIIFKILSGGSESVVRHWKVNGEAVRSVPVSSSISHVLAMAHNTGGSSQYEVFFLKNGSEITPNFYYIF